MKSNKTNWEWKKLEEVSLSVSAGGTPRRNIKEYWENGTVPWLKISDLKSIYITSSEEKITEKGLKESSAKLFPKGTVIYSIFATLGAIAILDIEATTNQAIVGIVPDNKKIDTKFLFYCLKSERENILKKKSNATQDNINLGILRNHEIPVPLLPIQQKIVSILERAESLKQKREQSNEEADKIIQNIFYKMFGDSHTNEKKFELLTGNEVFVLSSGKFNPTKNLDDSYSYPTYGGNGVTGKSNEYLIDFDTLVIGRVGAYCGSVYKTSGKVWITDNAIYLKKFLRTVSLDYLLYFFKTQNLNKFAAQSGQPKITQKPIENMKIPLPPISLQNQFASIVEKIESLKQKQKQATAEINTLFDALMQKAFNGELVS